MDIEVILRRARQRANRIMEQSETTGHVDGDTAVSLAEFFQDIDEWITKGGFLPVEWRH